MSESKSQSKPSLVKAKAVLRQQWPEVLQYMGDRLAPGIYNNQSKPSAEHFSSPALNESAAKA
jgi:hypothetical protein